MSRLRAQGEERVSLGACQCPGTPHEEDEAFLSKTLDPFDASEATYLILGSKDDAAAIERDVSFVLLRGVKRWNLLDDEGPIDVSRIRELDWATISPLADAAALLYNEELMSPLRKALRGPSQHGQTDDSTSATSTPTDESP